jgi:hypothetical protein
VLQEIEQPSPVSQAIIPSTAPARPRPIPSVRILCAAVLVAFAWTAASSAASTTTVVGIPAVDGGIQRFLHVRPDSPIAFVVQFPGGDGDLGLQDNGSMTTRVGVCNPFGRSRAAFAGRRIGLALIDKTSNGSTYDYENLHAVVRYVRERDNVPVWIAGGSASTFAAARAAVRLPAEIPAGVILYSPDRARSTMSSIRRPAAVIWHAFDTGQAGASTFNALTSAPVRENLIITAGNNGDCTHHLFNGADAEFVNAAAGAIERNNAATVVAPAIDMGDISGTWYNPATTGQGFFLEAVPSMDIMILAWFTWGNASGAHFWLTGVGPLADNGATVDLIRTANGRFNAPDPVTDTVVGTATLHFTDCGHGTVTYQRDDTGESGTIAIERLTPVPASCEAAEAP